MWQDLTASQKRGFNWAAKQWNAANKGGKNTWTGQEVALARLQEIGNTLYAELSQRKLERFAPKFAAMTPQEQTAFLQSHSLDGDD